VGGKSIENQVKQDSSIAGGARLLTALRRRLTRRRLRPRLFGCRGYGRRWRIQVPFSPAAGKAECGEKPKHHQHTHWPAITATHQVHSPGNLAPT